MKAQTLRHLLDGDYICPIAYPLEFEYLEDAANQDAADRWLGDIDMRLARLGSDGAFFMAPRTVSPADTTRIRDDFARYRDVYGPAHRMLQLIRAGKDEFTLGVGELIQLAELNQAVNESTTLETQLRGLHSVIKDGSLRYTNRELLKRLLEHLRNDGYLVLINPTSELYKTTGKLDQLKQVLTFLAENSDIVGDPAEQEDAGLEESLFDEDRSRG